MKLIVQVPQEVLLEVNEAASYYDAKQKGLGDKLYDDFENTLYVIEKSPRSFQQINKNFRHALLTKFPHLVVFRIYSTQILVNKFIHAKKHPLKRHK